MTKLIEPIVKSVGDQVLEAPIESIFSLEYGRIGTLGVLTTALHRTGRDGWLTTRKLPGDVRSPSSRDMYVSNDFIKQFIDNPGNWVVVRLLESGPKDL